MANCHFPRPCQVALVSFPRTLYEFNSVFIPSSVSLPRLLPQVFSKKMWWLDLRLVALQTSTPEAVSLAYFLQIRVCRTLISVFLVAPKRKVIKWSTATVGILLSGCNSLYSQLQPKADVLLQHMQRSKHVHHPTYFPFSFAGEHMSQ